MQYEARISDHAHVVADLKQAFVTQTNSGCFKM